MKKAITSLLSFTLSFASYALVYLPQNGESYDYFQNVVWSFGPGGSGTSTAAGTVAIYPFAENSTSIPNPDILGWATGYSNYIKGSAILPKFADPTKALGAITDFDPTGHVVTLGNGGTITLTFANPIGNGEGIDFAVFENGFSENYLELAYIEVSTDGINFMRFPNFYLGQSIIGETNAYVDPLDIYNLASKYEAGYGHGFDLSELTYAYNYALSQKSYYQQFGNYGDFSFSEAYMNHVIDSFLLQDLNNIKYVKIIDIYGDGSSLDSAGNLIYDPIPDEENGQGGTPGFDLRGVAVIHYGTIPEPSTYAFILGIASLLFVTCVRKKSKRKL